MKDISTEEILDGIVNNNSFIIHRVYKKFFVNVSRYIQNNGGRIEDARDVFQDGIMVIYDQRKQQNLEINTSFNTYIFSVCKFIWLNKLRDKRKMTTEEYNSTIDEMNSNGLRKYMVQIEELSVKEERARIYQRNFEKLSNECRKLLKMVANGLNIKEIQIRFGYKSEKFTYKKRSICKDRLIKLIEQDNKFRDHES